MPEVSVATLNLFNRMGDWDARFPLVIEQLLDLSPDVIAFQEIDLMLDQGMQIAREVNKRLGAGAPHYRIKHAASPGKMASVHGIGTMSRLECTEHTIIDLMSHDRIAQCLVYRAADREFAFVNTHLHYPPEAIDERAAQAEYLLARLDADARELPLVVAGDFNAYADGPDGAPEKTVTLMKSRFRSAYEAVHGREPEKTWSTPVNTYDPSPHGTLDYIFLSSGWQLLDAGLAFHTPSPDNPHLYPSDHLGLFARLRV